MSGYSVAVTGNVPSNVPINFVTNAGTATSAANNINIFGIGGTNTSGSGNTILISSTSTALNWNDENADFSPVVNEGYFCTAALTASLPAMATQGNMINIICETASPVIIKADATQFISIGSATSSLGGTATSNATGDSLVLIYRSASSTWHALSLNSTWTLN